MLRPRGSPNDWLLAARTFAVPTPTPTLKMAVKSSLDQGGATRSVDSPSESRSTRRFGRGGLHYVLYEGECSAEGCWMNHLRETAYQ